MWGLILQITVLAAAATWGTEAVTVDVNPHIEDLLGQAGEYVKMNEGTYKGIGQGKEGLGFGYQGQVYGNKQVNLGQRNLGYVVEGLGKEGLGGYQNEAYSKEGYGGYGGYDNLGNNGDYTINPGQGAEYLEYYGGKGKEEDFRNGYRYPQGQGRFGIGYDHRTLFADSFRYPITPETYKVVGRGFYRSLSLASPQGN